MLLLVNNPRSACPLIDFCNDLKKSGLYVLGHVKVGGLEDGSKDPAAQDYPKWMALVDHLKVKAFVEVTVAPSVRDGLHHLARVSGLGAMKPNTILLGFKDNTPSQDFFTRDSSPFNVSSYQSTSPTSSSPSLLAQGSATTSHITGEEYVKMILDVLNLGKNVCLCRHFHQMDKAAIFRKGNKQKYFIDVWPVDFFNPDESNIFGTTSLFLMQLATILNMVSSWRKKTMLRVFLCVSSRDADPEAQKTQVKKMLLELRINATIVSVPWDHITTHLHKEVDDGHSDAEAEANMNYLSRLNEDYINGVNGLISGQSVDTAVTFLHLPCPPENPALHAEYLNLLTSITNGLKPTVMVHGISAVTTTNL